MAAGPIRHPRRLGRPSLGGLLGAVFLGVGITSAPTAAAQEWAIFVWRAPAGEPPLEVRLPYPAAWRRTPPEDDLALAEWRGRSGDVAGILQLARGRPQADITRLCQPERARTMLADVEAQAPGTRVTDVIARAHHGRPGFDLRYDRADDQQMMRVQTRIICLRDTRLVVSCAASVPLRQPGLLGGLVPVCARVLEGIEVTENEPARVDAPPAGRAGTD